MWGKVPVFRCRGGPGPGAPWACLRAALPGPAELGLGVGRERGPLPARESFGEGWIFFFSSPSARKGGLVWVCFVCAAPLLVRSAPLSSSGRGFWGLFNFRGYFFFFLSTFFVIFLVVGSPFSPLGKRCSTSLLSARHPSPCAGGRGQLRGAHPGAELRSGASPPRAGCTRPAWLLSTPPTSACGQRRTAPPRGRRPAAASRWTRRR